MVANHCPFKVGVICIAFRVKLDGEKTGNAISHVNFIFEKDKTQSILYKMKCLKVTPP